MYMRCVKMFTRAHHYRWQPQTRPFFKISIIDILKNVMLKINTLSYQYEHSKIVHINHTNINTQYYHTLKMTLDVIIYIYDNLTRL